MNTTGAMQVLGPSGHRQPWVGCTGPWKITVSPWQAALDQGVTSLAP